MLFPEYRPRRMRRTEALRRMIRETVLTPNDLILPLFAVHGKGVKNPIDSMPGQFQLSIEYIAEMAKEAYKLGIPAVMLFGVPKTKNALGTEAYAKDGIVQTAIRAVKNKVPEMVVITDVCMCQYTDHGHCGILEKTEVNNDATIEILANIAVSHAKSGSDMVAPSDMMDGRVGEIREALDDNSYYNIPIMSYAVKYCSAFYGPFRQAAHSAPKAGDRKSYQMDPANILEAVREASMDVEEGADIIMVKPALSYLDVISKIRDEVDLPVAAYNVSGEYAMIKAAEKLGWVDGAKITMEILTSIKRAGADMILSYSAMEAAKMMA
ncbi:porphobilinogen synthase [Desulforegula conservatrix]|uniref:porphobilinogen synthase n=1 Tax=Desulforegula conservatrix TaxID=153026 RepID=UPI0004123C17|nr:porphobilinogen synthase [Desulforegula conservatrix]